MLLIVFGVIIPFLLLYVTIHVDSDGEKAGEALLRSLGSHERKPLDYLPNSREISELKLQIRELEEVRASVRDELRVFEQKRTKLSSDIASNTDNLARVKKDLTAAKKDLQDTRSKLSKATRDFYDKVEPVVAPAGTVAPIIILPPENKVSSLSELKLSQDSALLKDSDFAHCKFPLCFQYTRCPLTQPFTVYVYNDAQPSVFPSRDDALISELVSSLKKSNSLATNPELACVYIAIVDSSVNMKPADIERKIHALDYWRVEGANHVLIELSNSKDGSSVLEGVSTGRAVVARAFISPTKLFRPGYDILVPPLLTAPISWRDVPPMLPAFRENLIYFQGDYQPPGHPSSTSVTVTDMKTLQTALDGKEHVFIELQCPGSDRVMLDNAREGEWGLCGGQTRRLALCSQSTFSLIPGPGGVRNGLGTATYIRLVESLICGSIPVLIGIETLPFDDVIDWRRATLTLPPGRFSDIHYILRSIDQDSILDYRLQGRNLWQMYLTSSLTVVQSVLAVVRHRMLHPPPVAQEFVGVSLYSQSGSRKRLLSPVLTQNFTVYSQDFWNTPPGPFFIYPTTPFKTGPISGYQYVNLDDHARARLPLHIVDGGGITGPNFEDLLLGNSPEEQFTVVMLTYQRNTVLVEALARLKDVSFLNKVVVVWNNEEEIPPDMEWPDIGVPIEVRGLVC